MIDRSTKLRWRRNFRRKQRQLEDIGSQTEERLDRHFFRRLGRLYDVRRFTAGWLLLIILLLGLTVVQTRALSRYYQTIQPLAGGIYTEGAVGTYTNANPIFATSDVDLSISRLLFSSLFMYNSSNQFVGDLATNIAVDQTGKIYTVKLRPNVQWHDKKPLTSADVLFTYQVIQNPDARSPLFSAWQGVKVEAPDPETVVFTLPNVLASFPYSLTNGILPKHVLEKTDVSSLRSALFNTTEPVGSGPFVWHGVEVSGNKVEDREQHISLSANDRFFKGRPKLNEIVIHTFLNEEQMLASFTNGELTAMSGVQDLPEELRNDHGVGQYNVPLTGAVMAFMNTTNDVLKEVKVRRALVSAVDQQSVLMSLGYPSIITRSPLLRTMLGYDGGVVQRPFDINQANTLLDEAGWPKGADGMRYKDGKKLTLVLNTLSNVEYASVANNLRAQWQKVGVDVTVTSLSQADLQIAIDNRSYGLLLYGISLGQDPDQFAYWHSSQADLLAKRRLNFSNYSSKAADAALEAGRTRVDATLRAAKYKPFLEAWRDDAPALALYQPRYLYVSRGRIYGFDMKAMTASADRFADVEKWMIRTERVTNE